MWMTVATFQCKSSRLHSSCGWVIHSINDQSTWFIHYLFVWIGIGTGSVQQFRSEGRRRSPSTDVRTTVFFLFLLTIILIHMLLSIDYEQVGKSLHLPLQGPLVRREETGPSVVQFELDSTRSGPPFGHVPLPLSRPISQFNSFQFSWWLMKQWIKADDDLLFNCQTNRSLLESRLLLKLLLQRRRVVINHSLKYICLCISNDNDSSFPFLAGWGELLTVWPLLLLISLGTAARWVEILTECCDRVSFVVCNYDGWVPPIV